MGGLSPDTDSAERNHCDGKNTQRLYTNTSAGHMQLQLASYQGRREWGEEWGLQRFQETPCKIWTSEFATV